MTLREFGRKLAAKKGLHPLQPGQTRPVGFYMVDHTTGRPLIADRNAVVINRSEPTAARETEPLPKMVGRTS